MSMLQLKPLKNLLPLFLLLSFMSTPLFSLGQEQEEVTHPIDVSLESCLSADSNFTTQGMMGCYYEARQSWDLELNLQYTELRNLLDSASFSNLQKAQRSWLSFRDKEFDYINYLYYQKNGSMWRVVASERRMDIIRTRALELKSYYNLLDEK